MVERSNQTVIHPNEFAAMQDQGISWTNAWEYRGSCMSWDHAVDLMLRIGSSEPWAFLVLSSRTSSRFAQCCGHAHGELAVEVGDGSDEPRLVVPRGACDLPEALTTCGRWSYWASPMELLTVPSAIEIIRSWLERSLTAPGFEFHEVHVGGGWVDQPARVRRSNHQFP